MSKQAQVVPVVSIVNQQATTTSLNVAEVFGKQHKDVLRAIGNLEIPNDFRQRNFAPNKIKVLNNQSGEEISHYNITRDGLMLLAFGFTGAKAMKFKFAYIEAFNQMEAALTERALPPPKEPVFTLPNHVPQGQKRCAKCGEVKPVSLFGQNLTRPDGLATYCKECKSNMNRATAEANRKRNMAGQQLPPSAPEPGRQTVSREEFDAFVSEYRIRNKVMNEYLDDIWVAGDGILSVADQLGKLDEELAGVSIKATRTRGHEGIVTDIEAIRKETQLILSNLLETTSLFFVKHSKLNQGNPAERPVCRKGIKIGRVMQ